MCVTAPGLGPMAKAKGLMATSWFRWQLMTRSWQLVVAWNSTAVRSSVFADLEAHSDEIGLRGRVHSVDVEHKVHTPVYLAGMNQQEWSGRMFQW